jgi:hypothetical protein
MHLVGTRLHLTRTEAGNADRRAIALVLANNIRKAPKSRLLPHK